MAAARATTDLEQYRGRPLGRILVKLKKINRDQVHQALEIQKEKGGPLGQILVELGYIDEDALAMALGFQAGMDWVDLEKIDLAEDVVNLIPAQMATTYKVIPVAYDASENHLTVAVASPDNFHATDDLRTLMGFHVTARVTTSAGLDRALSLYYDVGAGDSEINSLNQ